MTAGEPEIRPTETVEEFRLRARAWLAEAMPRADPDSSPWAYEERYQTDRGLERSLWDGGFAGICFPAEYGGLGLSEEHQLAFSEESLGYEMPFSFNVPTFGILAATLIDHGSHEQKLRHLPAILRGDELWVQFLSEPTGGSDLAGCLTRADRDGDSWVLSGSKIWSSGAYAADYALCLARTNWDVPKHRGLTMFIVEIHQPGIQVDQIRQVDGSMEFCQEYFDDVVLPPGSVVGEVDNGWTVALDLLAHERAAVGGGSPYTTGRTIGGRSGVVDRGLMDLAERVGRDDDPVVRQAVGEVRAAQIVAGHLVGRVSDGIVSGALPPSSGAITKLFGATNNVRRSEALLETAGSDAVVWVPEADRSESDRFGRDIAEMFIGRQGFCLGGGSNEIQRNVISERVLGMPREWAADKDVAYRDVRRNTMPTAPPG